MSQVGLVVKALACRSRGHEFKSCCIKANSFAHFLLKLRPLDGSHDFHSASCKNQAILRSVELQCCFLELRHYSSLQNKRTCTPYSILTNLPPCTLLFGPVRLFIFGIWNFLHLFQYFKQNSSLYPYSGLYAYLFFVKIPPCMLIREVRLFGRLEYFTKEGTFSSKCFLMELKLIIRIIKYGITF